MVLSDALSQAEVEIKHYRDDSSWDDTYGHLHVRLDKVLCEIIAMRMELDCDVPGARVRVEDNVLYKAVKRGSMRDYSRFATQLTGIIDTWELREEYLLKIGYKERHKIERKAHYGSRWKFLRGELGDGE